MSGWGTSWEPSPKDEKEIDKASHSMAVTGIGLIRTSLDKADALKIEHVDNAIAFLNSKQNEKQTFHYSGDNLFPEINHVELFVDAKPDASFYEQEWIVGIDPSQPGSDETIYGVYTSEGFKPLTKEQFEAYDNVKPTHDPYVNPNAHIYYECGCGAILDPGTKRFAALNNCASEAGWKVRWGEHSYVPYCNECGKGVE
jgi:hypothetical protein